MADTDTLAPPDTKTKPRPDAGPPPINYDRVGQALGLSGTQRTLEEDRAKIDAMEPGPPKLTPPPPVQPPTDPFQAFGQPAMWLAALGGLLTRHPLTQAIQSAGAVLDATRKLDDQAAQRAMAEWKVNSENALKMTKYEQDAYKAAISKYATDARAGEAEIKTLAGAFQNAALMRVYETEGMDGVTRYLRKSGGDAVTLAKRQEELNSLLEKKQNEVTLFNTWKKANPKATPQQTATAKLLISEGKDPSEILAKEYSDPKEVEITRDDGTTEKMMVQQSKSGHGWFTADENLTPVRLEAGKWTVVKGSGQKPPPPGAADALEAWKKQYPDSASNALALNAAINTITHGGVPNDQGLPIAKPTAPKTDTPAAKARADVEVVADVNLKKKNGEPVTPEEQKAADQAQARIDAGIGIKAATTEQTAKARAAATPEKPQTTKWEPATDPTTGDSFYQRIGADGKPQYQTLNGFPMEAPSRIARQAASPALGSTGSERNDRFQELKKYEQSEGKYAGDSAVWDKVDQQLIAIKENHISPAAAKMIAEQAIAGDYSGLIGWGRSPGIRKDLENALTEEAASRHLSGSDLARMKANYAAFTQGVKSFEAGGAMEKPTRSLSVAVDHLHLLLQTAQAVATNNTRFLNAAQNELEREFGYTAAPTFDAIRGTVAAEIEKAVTGGGGAVADREDLKSSLSKNLSPQALNSVIAAYEGLMGGQLNGIRSTYQRLQRIEGQTGDNFDKDYLTPRALEVLTGRKAAAPAAPAESGTIPAAALAHLKENEPTTFKNGQTWMLKDGQPFQVK